MQSFGEGAQSSHLSDVSEVVTESVMGPRKVGEVRFGFAVSAMVVCCRYGGVEPPSLSFLSLDPFFRCERSLLPAVSVDLTFLV